MVPLDHLYHDRSNTLIIQVNTLLGGGTPIYSVLQSLSLVKMIVKGQPPKEWVVKCLTAFGWTRVNLAFYVEYGYCTS